MSQIPINAGKYDKRISIYQVQEVIDAQGFATKQKVEILSPYAYVKTTRGYTLIANDTDFEKAYTNFTIRYPRNVGNHARYDNRIPREGIHDPVPK